MAGYKNIVSALENVGSDACWTIPGEVEWSQGYATGTVGVAPGQFTHLSASARSLLEAMKDVSGQASEELQPPFAEVRRIETARSFAATRIGSAHLGNLAVAPNVIGVPAV